MYYMYFAYYCMNYLTIYFDSSFPLLHKGTVQTAPCVLRHPPPLLFPGAAVLRGILEGAV